MVEECALDGEVIAKTTRDQQTLTPISENHERIVET